MRQSAAPVPKHAFTCERAYLLRSQGKHECWRAWPSTCGDAVAAEQSPRTIQLGAKPRNDEEERDARCYSL
jgi:hypothetical protein